MKNSRLSKIIKEVREDKDLNVEVLSILTKIPAKYIEAIESNSYDKIPKGPYVKLYMNQIIKVLNIDTKTYVFKEERAPQEENNEDVVKPSKLKDTLKKEEVEVKIDNVVEKKEKNPAVNKELDRVEKTTVPVKKPVYSSKDTKVKNEKPEEAGSKKGLIVFVLIILIGIGAYVATENSTEGTQDTEVLLEDSEMGADSNEVDEVVEKMSTEDSLSRAIEISDSLELVKLETKKDFEKKNKDDRKKEKRNGWNNPAYKESAEKFFKQKYSNESDPKLVIRATGGYVKIKLLSRAFTWWKKVDYQDSLVVHMPTSASIIFYNAQNCEAEYKGKAMDFKNYNYAKYLFRHSKSFQLQKVFH